MCFTSKNFAKLVVDFHMIVRKVKSEIVAHISYFIGSASEAFVVDPRRDPQIYVEIAKQEQMNIKYIFETHRNEDYIIGSKELASLTDAEIYHGPWPDFCYGKTVSDGQNFKVGNLMVKVIHTPGHTPGCMSYTVSDLDSGKETILVCTGDTLFVNETGRTDFGGPKVRQEWSENLYNSIFNKLLPLGDHVILCPAHGAGSICGSGIAEREWSTLGIERLMNPKLQKTKEEFIKFKVQEHHEYIPYFRMMEKYNVEGAPFVGLGKNLDALSAKEFQDKINSGAVILDTRSPAAFTGAHIAGSYSIPTGILSFVGWLLSYDKPIILIVDSELDYITSSLSRIGYDNIDGYLADGIESWFNSGYPLESSGLLSAAKLKERLDSEEKMVLLDVRSKEEFEERRMKNVRNIYAGHLEERVKEIPKENPIVTICQTGNRASLAASILLKNGYDNVYNLLGGMSSWSESKYPTIK
jgi:hydroxyacylglutathione hydrolase